MCLTRQMNMIHDRIIEIVEAACRAPRFHRITIDPIRRRARNFRGLRQGVCVQVRKRRFGATGEKRHGKHQGKPMKKLDLLQIWKD